MHYQISRIENIVGREFHPPPPPHPEVFSMQIIFDYLVQDQERDKKFYVCGISSSDPDKVWNGVFFKQCMGTALHNLQADDANEIDDDRFELYN